MAWRDGTQDGPPSSGRVQHLLESLDGEQGDEVQGQLVTAPVALLKLSEATESPSLSPPKGMLLLYRHGHCDQ